MTLVERYVRAIRDFLPRAQQDDILAVVRQHSVPLRGRGGRSRSSS